MKSETRLRNCSVLGVSEKSISILAGVMICIATGNADRQEMKASESGCGFAHYVEDVAVGVVVTAEEIVLAAGLVESGERLGIVGVLFSQFLDAALVGTVVVVPPVLCREHEAVHAHESGFRDELGIALDRAHPGIVPRPIFGGFGRRIRQQPCELGYHDPSSRLQEPAPCGQTGGESLYIDGALGPD